MGVSHRSVLAHKRLLRPSVLSLPDFLNSRPATRSPDYVAVNHPRGGARLTATALPPRNTSGTHIGPSGARRFATRSFAGRSPRTPIQWSSRPAKVSTVREGQRASSDSERDPVLARVVTEQALAAPRSVKRVRPLDGVVQHRAALQPDGVAPLAGGVQAHVAVPLRAVFPPRGVVRLPAASAPRSLAGTPSKPRPRRHAPIPHEPRSTAVAPSG